MFDIFQQPWTLVGVAVFLLFVVFTIRSVFPEKPRRWLFLLPIATAGLAFGLDHFVQTDLEKVHAVLAKAAVAVQEEDYAQIAAVLSADYEDSRHDSKAALLAEARRRLDASQVQNNKKLGATIQFSQREATAMVTWLVRFEPDSTVARNYRPAIFMKMRLYLRKQPDGSWLINQAEITEIDRQPISWRQI